MNQDYLHIDFGAMAKNYEKQSYKDLLKPIHQEASSYMYTNKRGPAYDARNFLGRKTIRPGTYDTVANKSNSGSGGGRGHGTARFSPKPMSQPPGSSQKVPDRMLLRQEQIPRQVRYEGSQSGSFLLISIHLLIMSSSEENGNVPFKKARKSLSPEALEKLALARKKALEVKKELGDLRKAETQVAKKEKREAIDARKAKVEKALKPALPVASPPASASSSGDEDDEVVIVKRKPKKVSKPKRRIVYMSDTESESSLEEVRKRKPAAKKKAAKKAAPCKPKDYVDLSEEAARDELRRRLESDKIRIAMQSLFPNQY
ncbi:hypothetical protein WJX72_008455 [[Myrmecia] bisecta]|uniref:Uncharacterized protein n=1 Tax=[Myrmecia] bisecta TaxID=41462 RepID=A0AAW1PYZ7_9CHLO